MAGPIVRGLWAAPQKGKRVPDVIVYREISPAPREVFDVKTIGEHRLAAHLEAGWTVLVSESSVKAEDIAAAYFADQMAWRLRERLPFNRPRQA